MKSETLRSMHRLKLGGMASAYEAVMKLSVNQQPAAHALIATLLDAEEQQRSTRRTEVYLRLSKLRYRAPLSDIQCAESRNFTTETLTQLPDGADLQRGENILSTGATGCGKSFLACALGHQAGVLGWRTLYCHLKGLTEQIALARTDGTLITWLNRMKKANLLIPDDFGLQFISHDVKLILLQILQDRYEENSVIICSQLSLAKWYDYFDQPTLADAILDRIIPRAHRIELKGKRRRNNVKQLSSLH